ncbi:MAG: hypothetical protein HYY18_20975 [Planctomycetes bacterium]|nr:hypothetical protein [Planctomycetota bacterium]
MGAECEEVRRVIAGVLEGAVGSPHAGACGDCREAVGLERATRDRIRGAAPSRETAAAPRRARGRFPAAGLAAAALLGAIAWLVQPAGTGSRPGDARKPMAPGRSEPEWSLLRGGDAPPAGPFAARRSVESGLTPSGENR